VVGSCGKQQFYGRMGDWINWIIREVVGGISKNDGGMGYDGDV
jgi:hypothetical protein